MNTYWHENSSNSAVQWSAAVQWQWTSSRKQALCLRLCRKPASVATTAVFNLAAAIVWTGSIVKVAGRSDRNEPSLLPSMRLCFFLLILMGTWIYLRKNMKKCICIRVWSLLMLPDLSTEFRSASRCCKLFSGVQNLVPHHSLTFCVPELESPDVIAWISHKWNNWTTPSVVEGSKATMKEKLI